MLKRPFRLLAIFTLVVTSLNAQTPPTNAQTSPPASTFSPFTAKVTRSKVRVRVEPSLESPILKEVENGEMFVVTGETDEFYSIMPPEGTQAYIYRTFVLDNVVEGNKVNVRSSPNLEAPVISQLSSGYPISGKVCTANSKWLEIAPPQNVRFYVAKDYLSKIGPADLLDKMKKRKQEGTALLDQTTMALHAEFQKPFDEMQLEGHLKTLSQLQTNFADFPEIANQAKKSHKKTEEDYLLKKIAYLENKTKIHLPSRQEVALTKQVDAVAVAEPEVFATPKKQTAISTKWNSIEQKYFQEWVSRHQGKEIDEYYNEQEKNHVLLTGVLEPYTRSLKNKPGDFLLVDPINHLPIAYLYSTRTSIHDKIGQSITVHAYPRPNNHFAYPAYYVLSLE